MNSKRGVCACGARRVLVGGLCQSCIDEEQLGQQLDLTLKGKAQVVHVNDPGGYDVYIGRGVPRRGLERSIWANPYPINQNTERAAVLEMYRWYLNSSLGENLRSKLWELRGKRLGCWCKPEACHGDVLAELANNLELDPIDVEVKTYWLPLLKTDGQWDPVKIEAELHDLVFVFKQVAEVYEYITGGQLSKETYYADGVKQAFDAAVERAVQERLGDEIADYLAGQEAGAKFNES